MDRISIRRAAPADVGALLDMMGCFNRGEGIAWDVTIGQPALLRLMATPELGFVLIAAVGRDDAGYTVVTFNYDLEFAGREGFVTELFVRPQHRRAGVARLLLAAVEASARTEGVQALHLLALPHNTPALGLYESSGFERSPRIMLTKRIP